MMEAKLSIQDPPSQAARPAPDRGVSISEQSMRARVEALQSQGTELALRASVFSKNIPDTLDVEGGTVTAPSGGAAESQQTGRIWDGSWACCHQR